MSRDRRSGFVWLIGVAALWVIGGCSSEGAESNSRGGPGSWIDLSADAPQATQFNDVWAFAPDDVWVVGSEGTLLHFDGKEWIGQPSSTNEELTGIWAFGRNDIWVSGRQSVLRWNGQSWSRSEFEPTRTGWADLWGSSPNDVWLVGDRGSFVRWTGGAWQTVNVPGEGYTGIWGSDRKDVWAVGGDHLLHFDGLTWSMADVPFAPGPGDVWGFGPDDVWVVRGDESPAHFDGNSWKVHQNDFGAVLQVIWGTAPNDVWSVGALRPMHWNGRAWSQISEEASGIWLQHTLYGVHGSSARDVWMVGQFVGGGRIGGVIVNHRR